METPLCDPEKEMGGGDWGDLTRETEVSKKTHLFNGDTDKQPYLQIL